MNSVRTGTSILIAILLAHQESIGRGNIIAGE